MCLEKGKTLVRRSNLCSSNSSPLTLSGFHCGTYSRRVIEISMEKSLGLKAKYFARNHCPDEKKPLAGNKFILFIEIKHRADKMLGRLFVKLRKEIFGGHLKICEMAQVQSNKTLEVP